MILLEDNLWRLCFVIAAGYALVGIVGVATHARRGWAAAPFIAPIVQGTALAVLLVVAARYVVIEEGRDGLRARRAYDLANADPGATRIINRTRRPVSVARLEYVPERRAGIQRDVERAPEVITVGPGVTYYLDAYVHYLGPQDRPPERRKIPVTEDVDVRYWLFWD